MVPESNPVVKWEAHKRQAEIMAKKLGRMRSIAPARSARMMNCGETLSAYKCPSCGRMHVVNTNRCRDRLCPLCSWRLSIQRYKEMQQVMQQLEPVISAKRMRVCMLTLTVRNVSVGSLRECLQSYGKAWKRLYQSKAFREVYGWARCMEITYNQKSRTAHPHMHILIIWDDEKTSIAAAMKALKAAWRAAARLDYNPIIDLREAYSKEGESEVIAAAGEAFAYSIKPATTTFMSVPLLEKFANAIQGFKFISYGGAIKEARQALGLKDEEEEDIHNETICSCGNEMEHMLLAWSAGGYSRLQKEGGAAQ